MIPPRLDTRLRAAARQEQFLDVISREAAQARFHAALDLRPRGEEPVPLAEALGRVLARDVIAEVDVPGFDRASVDGFAIRASDTAGATDTHPVRLRLNDELLTPGVVPSITVASGTASVIATGGMLPRGADCVVMVEHTDTDPQADGSVQVEFSRPASPGAALATAGSDLARGETVLRAGHLLTSREIAMLAAVGRSAVPVWRRPRVAILSTGDELVAPGAPIRPGQVYDSNAAVLAAAVTELGAVPVPLGIVPDDEAALAAALDRALASADIVVLSGGTSKGAGDLAHRVVGRLRDPGIVVHGVALKPGKPLCLAVTAGCPVAILPGFPTSAIFTFHEFLAPVILSRGGRPAARPQTVAATLPLPVSSERGRTEYVLVSLVGQEPELTAAYPVAKGSGAVTSFAQADGFFAIPAMTEQVAAGTQVAVTLIGTGAGSGLGRTVDLSIIGSHCTGLDLLIGALERAGTAVKAMNVGSTGGLAAARRGECDIAGIHLLDPASGRYNVSFVTEGLTLLPGYVRQQGILFRPGDARFAAGAPAAAALAAALSDPACLMVNRNAGSGTRILIDGLLSGARPPGYAFQVKSHNAVAAAVAQGRADWGMAIETVARLYGLGFLPVRPEHYDFVVPTARLQRPAVRRFAALLQSPPMRGALERAGFAMDPGSSAVMLTPGGSTC